MRARLAGHQWRVQKEKFPFYKKTEFGALKEVRRDWATFPHLHRDICTAAGLDPATSAPGMGRLRSQFADRHELDERLRRRRQVFSWVDMAPGSVLIQRGSHVESLYFLTEGILSVLRALPCNVQHTT